MYSSQPDAANGYDSQILDGALSTTNYGTTDKLNVGEENGASQNARALIKFDLSTIPIGSIVTSAILYLKVAGNSAGVTSTLNVYRFIKAWTEEGVTWEKYNGVNNWTTFGGFNASDCENTAIGSVSVIAAASGEYAITLDAAKIEEMLPGGVFTNNGFMIKMGTESNDQHRWYSSDDVTASNRPKLVIEHNKSSGNFLAFF